MRFVFEYLKKYKLESLLAPLFKMLEALFELFVPLVMANIIDIGIATQDTGYIIRQCVLLIFLAIAGLGFAVTAQYFSAKAAIHTASAIRSDLFKKILSLSVTKQEQIGSQVLLTRLNSDVNQVQSGINMVLRLLLRSPFIVIGAVIAAFTVDVKSAYIFVIVIPVLAVTVAVISCITIPRYSKIQKKLEGVLLLVSEGLEGARVNRAFVRTDKAVEEFKDSTKDLSKLQIRTGKVSALLNPITYVCVNLGIVAIIYTCSFQVDKGVLLQGNVVAQVNYMSQILVELVKLANLIVLLMKALPCAARIRDIMEMQADERQGTGITDTKHSRIEEAPYIKFNHVSYRYPNAKESSIVDVTCDIEPGSVVGIIGGTGSGKTTFMKLLYHAYECSYGTITLNDRDIKSFSDSAVAHIFGIVPQKASLIKGTIRQNISLKGIDCDDESIKEALRVAQAFDFVMEKPGGLDYMVESNGKNFSGGQRQRLTIARALMGKPDILVFDDSASALDLVTEAALYKELLALPWHPTIFIVSQRASSIKNADKILVFDDGECVGMGKHEELLNKCPVYEEIYYCQFPKENDDAKEGGSL